MKFALVLLLCAWIPLGIGCTSPGSKSSSENTGSAENAGPAEPAGSAASLAGPQGKNADDAPAKAVPKGPAYLLRMIDYKSGARLELVNESHTAPLDQYSKKRDQNDLARKVTSDEWMNGLIGYLRENGWSKEVKKGSAPTMARESLRWSLELVGPDGASFVAEAPDAKGSQRTRLRTMQKAFIDTYNATQGFQAARVTDGEMPFKVPEYPSKNSKKP